MSTSGQFLTVPSSTYRASQPHRRNTAHAAVQSPRMQRRPATGSVASSSKVRLEDTPLGIPVSAPASSPPPLPPPPSPSTTTTNGAADGDTTTQTSTPTSSAPQSSSPKTSRRRQTLPALPVTSTTIPLPSSPTAAAAGSARPQSPQLSPRSIFRAMPFLLRLRSPPSDLLSLTCTSGGPRTHSVLNKCQMDKAPQALTYNRALVCADAVNAEVLLRLARNELLERAQQTNRQVTALVDEEYVSFCTFWRVGVRARKANDKPRSSRWRYTIRQTKSGDYNVQVGGPLPSTSDRLTSISSIRCSTRHVPPVARARISTWQRILANPSP